MKAQGIVVGHHGCVSSLARKVLWESEALLPGPNLWDWLGSGIYFWEANLERALDWNPTYRNSTRDTWSALGAVIDLGNCLDLFDRACVNEVKAAYLHLKTLFEGVGATLPQNVQGGARDSQFSKRLLDCMVINHLHKLRDEDGKTPYDSVRCGFSEGQELYPGAMLFEQTHIQICVRNPRSILGYFKPVGINL